jgi:hypothetical protein
MKTLKLMMLFAIVALASSSLAKAQATEEKAPPVIIPESYQQTQKQTEADVTAGTATYNIDENETQVDPQADPGAAPWHSEGDVEILRVYSGSQNGNNLVKTIEVRRNPDASGTRSEYVPK